MNEPANAKPIRLLLVEDSDRDGALLALQIRRGGYAPQLTRVETREEMLRELTTNDFDVVLSDYCLPLFDAPGALKTLQESGRDIPFIVVSGAVGEEIAVGMMKSGAHDYVTKDKLARLVPAIEREMEEAKERRARRRAESLFEAILRSAPDPTCVVDRQTFQVVESSASFQKLIGEGSARGGNLFEILTIVHPERVEQLLQRGRGTAWYVVYEKGEQTRVANVRVHSIEYDGASYAYLVLEDVTDQHYLKSAFDAVQNAVLILSPQNTLLYANRAAEELFETLVSGIDVTPLLAFPELGDQWWTRPTPRYEEYRLKIDDKPYEAASVSFRFAGHDSKSTILTLRNLQQEEELLQLATHDALTGLHNLRFFNEELARHLASRPTEPAAFAIIDLDYFKPINDELGHAAGDAALITFASLLRSELRASDVLARIGGDEFAVLFRRNACDAEAAITRIYERLSRTPFTFENSSRLLSASIGLTDVRTDDDRESLKQRADEALYEAKRGGRGRCATALLTSSTNAS